MNEYVDSLEAFKCDKLRFIKMMMIHTRRAFFGYSIEFFDFFVNGDYNATCPRNMWIRTSNSVGSEKTAGSNMDPRNFYQPVKMDSSIEHISRGSADNYVSALLPKDIESIEFKITPEDGESDQSILEAQKLSKSINKIFINSITTGVPNFMSEMHRIIKDYTNYGNCACLHGVKNGIYYIKHLPFRNTYFWSSHDDKTFVFMYQEIYLRHEFISRFPEYAQKYSANQTSASRANYSVSHLYFNSLEVFLGYGENKQTFSEEEFLEYSKKLKAKPGSLFHVILDNMYNKIIFEEILDHNPILTSKNNTMANMYGGYSQSSFNWDSDISGSGDITGAYSNFVGSKLNLYGRGAGVQSIGNIVGANLCLQLWVIGSILSISPAILLPLGTILNKGKDLIEGHLDLSPGRTNTITGDNVSAIADKGSQAGNLQVLSQPQIVISSFLETYQMHIKQIENAYNSELFSIAPTPNQTATEVIQRQQNAIRQFKGQSSPLYSQLLLPLLYNAFNVLRSGVASNFYLNAGEKDVVSRLGDSKYKIDVFSFETQNKQEINAAKAEKYLGLLIQLAQAQIEVPGLGEKINECLRALDESYAS